MRISRSGIRQNPLWTNGILANSTTAAEIRDGTADLLKGTAVVLMIQVHIVELFAQPEMFESWIGQLSLLLGGPPVAPVFMIVMGYFAGRSNKAAGSLAVRGITLLGLGFALNLGLNAHLLLKIYRGELQLGPWEYVFGVDILFLAGLSLIIMAIFRPLLGPRPWAWIVAAAIVVLVTPIANEALTAQDPRQWLYAYVAGDYWWCYFPLFPWLAYPLLGVSVRLWNEQMLGECSPRQVSGESHARGLFCGAMLVLVLAITLPRVISTCHDLPEYYHHGGWLFLWLSLFLLVWVRLAQGAERLWGRFGLLRWLKWMGRQITVVYVLQWLIIGNIATAVYKTQGVAGCLLWGLFVLAAVNALAWLWTVSLTRISTQP